ncbi:DUF3105 domain-containing protein [Streptomyces physcomitrii]|uniref:DUF3105 domain-containing protein n=1 Tax=Streptomyces physcomitrii TaxID=2724184 RepID=A0ABX1H4G4_9ACTN|nr:DUF3105 domain-containing protein [Streptomyces physcomitrii]NKI42937.1 DUF3105 domain-containing protein [Streptomyces physcomitrii]
MGSARNSNNTRKARIEEMRRAEQARERRNRALTITGVAVIVAALVGGGFLLVAKSGDDDSGKDDAKAEKIPFTVGKDGVTSWDAKKLKRDHVGEKVSYPMNPPVGGKHNPVWLNCNGDVYGKEVPKENAVHALEHGAVWVTYTSKAPKADLAKLEAKVKKTPYSLMSPIEDQKDPIMLSAWGKQRTVQGADDPNVNKFFSEFVQGKQTPEPGAACTGGVSK